jgi:hypothetical protein
MRSRGLATARRVLFSSRMKPIALPLITIVEPSANDLPLSTTSERARRRERDRRLRGPIWSEPERSIVPA